MREKLGVGREISEGELIKRKESGPLGALNRMVRSRLGLLVFTLGVGGGCLSEFESDKEWYDKECLNKRNVRMCVSGCNHNLCSESVPAYCAVLCEEVKRDIQHVKDAVGSTSYAIAALNEAISKGGCRIPELEVEGVIDESKPDSGDNDAAPPDMMEDH